MSPVGICGAVIGAWRGSTGDAGLGCSAQIAMDGKETEKRPSKASMVTKGAAGQQARWKCPLISLIS
ncbi:unnamed protein product [Lota lota]